MRNRRARTRRLIEYGGLVVKAGLAELLADDRATMLGGFLSLRDQLTGVSDDRPAEPTDPAILKQRWRRRGLRTFNTDVRTDGDARRGSAGEGRWTSRGDNREEPMPGS